MAPSPEVQEALSQLVASLRPQADRFGAQQVERIRANVPPGSVPDDPWFWEAIERSYSANVALAFELFASGSEGLPDELPAESVELARAVARAGLPLEAIANVFRTGQSRFWEAWRGPIESLGFDPALTLDVLDEVMAFGSRYLAWTGQEVAARYMRELESSADTLLALVRQVLDGRAAQDVQLGYALHGQHLALAVTGARAKETALRFAAELDRRPLVVSPAADTAWAWLGTQTEPDARRRRALGELAAEAGVVVGVGCIRAGIHGFRRSHEEAQIACRCAATAGEPLAVYAEVLPEALALGDTHAAGELVARTLGPLGADRRGLRLRETLRAYCATGNGASAAALLAVSRRTLTYRLAEIERRLGAPIASRRTEIDLALRLEPHVTVEPAAALD
jgi:hypothetical protein